MKTADVTIHIDETLDWEKRVQIVTLLNAHNGVAAVIDSDETPHLMIVKYNPDEVTSSELLQIVLDTDGHAELIGL